MSLSLEEKKNVLAQLFAGGTALAGLVLVFLGSILASYEGFDTEGKSVVRRKYQHRAAMAFSGFVFALLAAGSGLLGMIFGPDWWLDAGILTLTVSGVLLVIMAGLSLLDIR